MRLNELLFLAIALSGSIISVSAKDCTVSHKNGEIIGAITDTFNASKKVCSYTAIPFAAPPIGNLRFVEPQPAPQWNGSFNATSPPNWCPQADKPPQGIQISEDCLYLNVHQPKSSSKTNLPVMIWFHGGAFVSGSATQYGPERLLARGDVILVMANYRLGLLGFYSTGDYNSVGNYGLKDQSFAIRWVHENIKYFGGNPRQITIFGESAGSASVVYQMISPLNHGRISGVIAQSGTALSMWALDKNPTESGKLMATLLGCPTNNTWVMVICMKFVPWQSLVHMQELVKYYKYSQMEYPFAGVTPVVEPWHPGAFIAAHPLEIMKKGNVPKIPLVIGATKHDGSFVLGVLHILRYGPQGLDKNPDYMRNRMVPELMRFMEVEENEANRGVSSSVELAYLNGVNRSSWNESMPGLVDIVSVFAFKSSTQNTADILSARGVPVYLYSFEHHSHNSLFNWMGAGGGGVVPVEGGIAHADDLLYLFNFPTYFSQRDTSFSEMFCDMWINFGSTGNPTASYSNGKTNVNVTWPVYNQTEERFMKLNNTPTVFEGYRSSWRPNGFEWN